MNKDNQLIFNEYLEEEKLAGHTKQGFSNLKSRVPKLFIFIEEMDYRVSGLGIREAQEYQGWLIKTGRKDGGKYSPKTVNSYLISASNFYEFAKRTHLVPSNPFKEIKRLGINKKLPRNLLKEKEMAAFLNELSQFDKEKNLKNQITRFRVYLMVELMYSTGLRISEVAGLTPADINFSQGTVNVREGKNARTRTAWLNDYTRELLRFYIEELRTLVFTQWQSGRKSLFGSGRDRLGHIVNNQLKALSKQMNLPQLTAHSFRHALGYHLLRSGCSIRYIQEILGHKLLRNTEIYTKVEKEDLKDILDTYHPRKFRRQNHEKVSA